MENKRVPLLSVCMITYNHAPYIRKAIEGVLMQQINFPWEFIIADDYSTDGTRDILIEYQQKFPSRIKLLLQDKNVGAARNWFDLLDAPIGKFIAYFEGDDYWTDPFKLQKQVDFLEQHPDYAISYHRVLELKNGKLENETLNTSEKMETYTLDDLSFRNIIYTPSVVFRNNLEKGVLDFIAKMPVGDYPLHLYNATQGKIHYLPDTMAVYRVHSQSIWSSKTEAYRREQWAKMLSLVEKSIPLTPIAKEHIKYQKRKDIQYLLSYSFKELPFKEFLHFFIEFTFCKRVESFIWTRAKLKVVVLGKRKDG
jgi:glycosyltransferase involved in cell wall biosynthesis